jgi:hypothetical protein
LDVGEQVFGGYDAVVEQDKIEDDCGGVDSVGGVVAPRTEVVAVEVGFVEEADCAAGRGEAGIDVGAKVRRLSNGGCSYKWSMQQYFGILISCETD